VTKFLIQHTIVFNNMMFSPEFRFLWMMETPQQLFFVHHILRLRDLPDPASSQSELISELCTCDLDACVSS